MKSHPIKSKTFTPNHKFDGIIGFFRNVLQTLPDKRTGKNKRYSMEDAALSAFSVFFMQSPSFLWYQRTMAATKGRSNASELIWGTSDTIGQPDSGTARWGEAAVRICGIQGNPANAGCGWMLEPRAVEDTLLVAMDGVEYFSSHAIACPHCSTQTAKDGTVRYFHSAATPVVVRKRRSTVLPLAPEFIVPQDGHNK